MHTVNLIASAITNDPERVVYTGETTQGMCAVTGKQDICVQRKELLGKSFTNGDLLAAPESSLVSLDAYYALTYKWERASSWYCNGKEFIRLDRKGVRSKVLTGQYSKYWSGYATTSYKKHGSLVTKVNTAGRAIWRFEMRDADCTDHKRLMAIWDRLNTELRAGIGRSILESLDCPPFLIKKFGVQRWLEFYRWAYPLYQGALYKFLCYLLPGQEELKLGTHGI